jgi:ABC-type amino acid transport substrate-binding protein
MQSKTLRCGYVVYPPTVIKDPNTDAMSGIMHDVIESAAAKIGLKVEWTEELNWGNFVTGLDYDHVDMICAAAWDNTEQEWQSAEIIGPIFYSGIGVWVRADDDRFTGHLEKINDPGVTVSSIDGTVPGRIAATDYPQAKILGMPQITDYTFNLLNVADKKADVTFVENYQGYAFAEKNPGVLKNIAADNPIRVFPDVYLVRRGEQKLKNTFDNLIRYMINSGELEPIIRKYEKYPGSFYRVAKPYQPPQS